jgi:hypothetical protein
MSDTVVNVGTLPDGSMSVCKAKPGNEGRYGCHHVAGSHVKMSMDKFIALSEEQAAKGVGSANKLGRKKTANGSRGSLISKISSENRAAFGKAFADRTAKIESEIESRKDDFLADVNDNNKINAYELSDYRTLKSAKEFNDAILKADPEDTLHGTIETIKSNSSAKELDGPVSYETAFNDANCLDAYSSISSMLPDLTRKQSDDAIEKINAIAEHVEAEKKQLKDKMNAGNFEESDHFKWNSAFHTGRFINDFNRQVQRHDGDVKKAYESFGNNSIIASGISPVGFNLQRASNPAVDFEADKIETHAKLMVVNVIMNEWK